MTDSALLSASCFIAFTAYRRAVIDFATCAGTNNAQQEVDVLFANHASFLQAEPVLTEVAIEALLNTANSLAVGSNVNTSAPEITTRQSTLFEKISLTGTHPPNSQLSYRYPLQALSVNSLFPQPVAACEPDNEQTAQAEYQQLWQAFCHDLDNIPQTQRSSLSLWLDHFDSLWQTYAHAIPATQANPDISLYDYTHTSAALAVALWRYHEEAEVGFNNDALNSAEHEKAEKFLLIQGDFFGVQDFIFASGGDTRKRAAKLLRGRSFYVSLLMECVAFHILDTLGLPITAQVSNAAGKLLIVAPNTDDVHAAIPALQKTLDDWFLEHTLGQSGIGLATLAASANDFSQASYAGLMQRLFAQLEQVKLRRFDLCNAPSALSMPDYLACFEQDVEGNEKGVCAVDGRSPAKVRLEDTENKWISQLADDQIRTGSSLTRCERLVLSLEPFGNKPDALQLPIFGFYVCFIANTTEVTPTQRVIDFALPQSEHSVLWRGYARRAINAWIPLANLTDKAEEEAGKYIGVDEELRVDTAKTLNHLACENRHLDQHGNWKGIAALMTLKGDVDDLGSIFQRGLAQPGFAKTAALSRQMNAFFSLWLPYRCKVRPELTAANTHPDYRNTYTVFAGGDDFFLIGPWHSTILLAQEMREVFSRYVAGNPQLHFSAGLSMSKPSLPINYLAHHAEAALDNAKEHIPPAEPLLTASAIEKPQQNPLCDPDILPMKPKNAVCCFERPVSWEAFNQLLGNAAELGELREYFRLSSGYFYDLLYLVSLREGMHKYPEYAIWNSKFQYRTWRLLKSSRTEDGKKLSYDERKRKLNELAQSIAAAGINQHQGDYRIALFTHLYQHRS